MSRSIILDFEKFSLTAELFESGIAERLYEILPHPVELTYWGDEAYGSVGIDFGTDAPQPTIPPGGIAYTNRGNFICLFFGQNPAWDVEYIGQINNDSWKQLKSLRPGKVIVRKGK